MNFLKDLEDFVYPRRCIACQSDLAFAEHCYCGACELFFHYLSLEELQKYQNKHLHPSFRYFYGAVQFDSLSQRLLHGLKYGHFKLAASYMADKIVNQFKSHWEQNQPQFLIPCPLHPRKERDREYNQASLISLSISQLSGIVTLENFVSRKRYTSTQTKLNKEERLNNLKNVFELNSTIEASHIAIVDDVITTGSTMNRIAECILDVYPKMTLSAISFACPV